MFSLATLIYLPSPLLTYCKKCLGLQCQTPIWLKALVEAIFFVLSLKLSYSEKKGLKPFGLQIIVVEGGLAELPLKYG